MAKFKSFSSALALLRGQSNANVSDLDIGIMLTYENENLSHLK